jgi:hypothetical protein
MGSGSKSAYFNKVYELITGAAITSRTPSTGKKQAQPSVPRKTSPPTLGIGHAGQPNGCDGLDILRSLVEWIHNEPYQLFKLKKGVVHLYGHPVRGWHERLKLYSYATNNMNSDYDQDFVVTASLLVRANALQQKLQGVRGRWNARDQQDAESLVKDIFDWGGVTGGNAPPTPGNVVRTCSPLDSRTSGNCTSAV